MAMKSLFWPFIGVYIFFQIAANKVFCVWKSRLLSQENVSKSVEPQNPVPIHQAKDENEEYN